MSCDSDLLETKYFFENTGIRKKIKQIINSSLTTNLALVRPLRLEKYLGQEYRT